MEQQLQKFMIQQFQPSGVSFRDGYENISEQLSPYFMPISVAPILSHSVILKHETKHETNRETNRENKPQTLLICEKKTSSPQTIVEDREKKPLDQYWAFWAAYIAANGMKSYENIPEKDRFKFRLEQKARASEWMVEDFKRTKGILAPHWYRLTNRDMEDMATSLMTNADESKEGLDCMVMMWNYYMYCGSGSGGSSSGGGGREDGLGSGKSASELYWIHPAKKVFYRLSMTNIDTIEKETASETLPNAGPVWGVFVKEKAGDVDHKKRGRNFSYELRMLNCLEKMEIENNMLGLSYVDKPLMAVSKYTLKELVDMGDVFGVRPPPSEKKSGNLDMENLVFEAEKNLGVIRKKPSVVKATEEKWKKGVWYENLEMYLSELF